jgi:MYXO-CTERM domain-containing protein
MSPLPRRRAAALSVILVAAIAGPAAANQPCASDGVVAATPAQPGTCPLTFYAPAGQGPLAVFRNGAEVTGFPFVETRRFAVTRHRAVCSTSDGACWRDLTDTATMVELTYTPGTPLLPGDVVGLGPTGVGPLATLTIGDVGACAAPVALTVEQCADPIGGDGRGLACTGGDFACDAEGRPLDDDGGCTTGGGGPGAAELGAAGLALVALAPRRRRR